MRGNWKPIDGKKFRRLYNEGMSHEDLKNEFSISLTSVTNYVKRLGLKRETTTALQRINTEKFKQQYLDGVFYDKLAKEHNIPVGMIPIIIEQLELPKRLQGQERVDAVKLEEMWLAGEPIMKIEKTLHTTARTIKKLVKDLDLPERPILERSKRSKPIVVEKPLVIENIPDEIPCKIPDVKPHDKYFIVPTLRQLEKQELRQLCAEKERMSRNYRPMEKKTIAVYTIKS